MLYRLSANLENSSTLVYAQHIYIDLTFSRYLYYCTSNEDWVCKVQAYNGELIPQLGSSGVVEVGSRHN